MIKRTNFLSLKYYFLSK